MRSGLGNSKLGSLEVCWSSRAESSGGGVEKGLQAGEVSFQGCGGPRPTLAWALAEPHASAAALTQGAKEDASLEPWLLPLSLGAALSKPPPGQGTAGHPALGLPALPASQSTSILKGDEGPHPLWAAGSCVEWVVPMVWDRPGSQAAWVPVFKSSLCKCQQSNCGRVLPP